MRVKSEASYNTALMAVRSTVIYADTAVAHNNTILLRPASENEATLQPTTVTLTLLRILKLIN